MVRVMDGPYTGPFNIGNPTEFTMLELAKVVQEVVNPAAEIVFRENTADDPSRRKPNISKVHSHSQQVTRRAPSSALLTAWRPFYPPVKSANSTQCASITASAAICMCKGNSYSCFRHVQTALSGVSSL